MNYRIQLNGVVQGVGFRPYAKRLGREMKLNGTVRNSDGILMINISGDKEALDEYVRRLTLNAPKSAVILSKEVIEIDDSVADETFAGEFRIIYSEKGGNTSGLPVIAADIATCDNCKREMYDKNNRRYMHPFISCVDCGPRFSIIYDIPYDRDTIVMKDFPMCPECVAEYEEISNRRCHAQTIACLSCGPKLSLHVYDEEAEKYNEVKGESSEILADHMKKMLDRGDVLAVKDIGGYHYVCRADRREGVQKLKDLKKRQSKAFAIMFNNIDEIKKYAFVSEKEEEVLLSDARPIVFLEKKSYESDIEFACEDSMYIGAMLPCNPVQIHISSFGYPLIMTSGNLGGEPIVTDDEKMKLLAVAKGVISGIVSHDRKILTPLDDSITRVVGGKMQILRRARGYVPHPIYIDSYREKEDAPVILASGGDLKGSFAYMKNDAVVVSQYFGDLDDYDASGIWKNNIKKMAGLLGVQPKILACDMHPRYYSSQMAKGLYEYDEVELIQHHHAHIASVVAEHDLEGEVLGFAFDGTGYGTDGSIWGSEVLLHKGGTFDRLLHVKTIPMCGGDEISRDGQMALMCYLKNAGIEVTDVLELDNEGIRKNALIDSVINYKVGIVYSSSMGRLFDAVATLLGIRSYNTYEGECAIALEKAAYNYKKKSGADVIDKFPLSMPVESDEEQGMVWSVAELIRGLWNYMNQPEYDKDLHAEALSYSFHRCIARAVVEYVVENNKKGLPVALSGGVFANKILVTMIMDDLKKAGHKVYINENVPGNDGGIALGQALIARERWNG